MPEMTWKKADDAGSAWTLTYSFGPGLATTLAVAVDDGVAVVSPCRSPTPEVFAKLDELGKLRAIVAPNAFHTMGLAPWKRRFPGAPIFAPAQSIARIEKQAKVSGVKPLAEAELGGKVELVDMPYYRTGEALIRWPLEGGGYAWFTTDVIMNLPTIPPGPFGWVMRLTKSAPGLRRNALSGTFTVKDRISLYRWLIEQAEKAPPRVVVPCHGLPLRLDDPAAGIRAALA